VELVFQSLIAKPGVVDIQALGPNNEHAQKELKFEQIDLVQYFQVLLVVLQWLVVVVVVAVGHLDGRKGPGRGS
jgi:hypothetical protein